ncbi:MAG: MFS transporter [Puniceicoccales bacterium]|nr:MFS transporter [Puniceicoccales bacterium]
MDDDKSYLGSKFSLLKFSCISTLLLCPSILGRTPLISCFKPYLQAKTHLNDMQISLAYSIGTLLASLLVPYAVCTWGKQLSLRKIFQHTYCLLAGCLVCLIAITVRPCSLPLTFLILCGIFTGIRLCGQGRLPLCIRTFTATLYDAKICSWMASLHTTFLVLCAGVVTYLLAHHNAFYQWHWVWGVEVIGLILIALCVPRKLPSMLSYSVKSVCRCAWGLKNFPSQFKWGLAIIALHNLQATAIAFHWSDFAIEKNIPLADIYKLFLPIAILELVFNPIGSWITHTIKFTAIHVLSVILILCSTSMLYFSSLSGRCAIVILCALGWSFNHVLSYSLPALLLSKEQMPLGFATLIGWTNLCSAIGPYLYSTLAYFNNSYTIANNYIIALNMLIWIPIASRKAAL